MPPIDWIAVLVSTVIAFVLGGLWYSPALFAKPWQQDTGLSDEQLNAANKGKIFGGSFILILIGAIVFGAFVGPDPSLGLALGAGASVGITWVAFSFGVNYLFELKPIRLFFINGGYHAVQFILFGVVFGLL
ncbi:MAG TPA: DUF1761 domain-containing protein [Xanthomonadales bacterium]|nr:DUF1761 domain-containing protein [Xanthomonadales bacterium]